MDSESPKVEAGVVVDGSGDAGASATSLESARGASGRWATKVFLGTT